MVKNQGHDEKNHHVLLVFKVVLEKSLYIKGFYQREAFFGFGMPFA
jgi:hypothetical protein